MNRLLDTDRLPPFNFSWCPIVGASEPGVASVDGPPGRSSSPMSLPTPTARGTDTKSPAQMHAPPVYHPKSFRSPAQLCSFFAPEMQEIEEAVGAFDVLEDVSNV